MAVSFSIDEYIEAQNEDVWPILRRLREVMAENAPEALEKISWGMPTFWQGENLIHFAAFKKHIGIYPGDMSDVPFRERLTGYKTSKGAIQFPLDKPIDYELIAEITRYRVLAAGIKRGIKRYEFEAVIKKVADIDGAYIDFPYDLKKETGKGRLKVHAEFDGFPYDGSIVNMGVKNGDGTVCYIIGIRKDIREKIGKQAGDRVRVIIRER